MYQQPHLFYLRIIAFLVICAHPLFGGVVLDGSFGTHGPLPGPNFMIQANFGRQVGGNLFQSFSQFNLTSTQSATFLGPNSVHNILARVTDGNPSSIDGRISSDIPGANLFFMNPAGVLFGQHAQLNVSGSFAVTTANYLKLVGGGRLNANLGGADVLTSAPVSAFGFLSTAPAGISVTGSTLNVAPQKVFSAVAGDIRMSGGQITGQGSRVNLISVKSPGEVQLAAADFNSAVDVTQFAALGEIDIGTSTFPINFTTIDTSGSVGGPIVIRGGKLSLNAFNITSNTSGSIQGGTIDIAITGDTEMFFGFLGTVAVDQGIGQGGNVSIHSGSLSLEGATILAESLSPGDSGDVSITVDKLFSIVPGGISTETYSSGKGGNISIHAESLSMAGFVAQILASTHGRGNAGSVTVTVDKLLSIAGGGEIAADTFSSGKGGDLTLHVGSLSIDGSALPDFRTGITVDSEPGATGDAGNLTITVDKLLSIVGAGEISTTTFSAGNGGDARIHAGSLSIDGSAEPNKFTGIAAESAPGASGNGGNLTVMVDQDLSIVGSGVISTATFSAGNGGNASIHAGSLSIDGSAAPNESTGIFADSESGASGNAGDLSITVDHALTVVGSGQISADTYSSGKGGNLTIHAGSLLVDGSAVPDFFTGISTDAVDGTGNGGDLTITVDGLLKVVGSGTITADTYSSGRGGNLTIHAGSLLVDGSAVPDLFTGISADAVDGTGNGGDLTITVDGLLKVVGSAIIATDTFTGGKGGDVSVRASSILIDGSATPDFFTGISAEADSGTGNGGKVDVTANDVLLKGGGSISASSFTSAPAGSVQVTAGSLRLNGMSDISSFNGDGGSGLAGSVVIRTRGSIILDGGSDISTLSDLADAGSINIIAGGEIKLKDQSSITVSAGHNGGEIHITTPDLVYLLNSSITATAGRNGVSGMGGNIRIDPTFIVLNNSLISANAAVGQGGNINLVSDFFFDSNSSITATGTTNGTVNITAPALDLGAELITLPISLLSAENQLQERCTALLQGDFSSFISIGRGGTEPAPEELQEEF